MTSGSTILVFPRSMNSASRRGLRKALLQALRASEAPVIVDLSGCHTLDHEDIDLLLDCVSQAVGRDTQLLLIAGSREIQVLLDVTRISSLVPVIKSLKEALEFKPYRTASNIAETAHLNRVGVVR
jgi:anti-anti-sigma regulatory factor